MFNNKNFFAGINVDDAIRLLSEGDYLNMENFRNGVSGLGLNNQLENIPSTLLIYDTGDNTNLTIGRAVDYKRKRLLWMNWDAAGEHAIYTYEIDTDTTYLVLLSSQTADGLNFSKDYRIDRNARILGDLLIFTDDNNEPRCFNIERCIKLNQPSYTTDYEAYQTGIPYTTLTLIDRPPIYPLEVEKSTDGDYDNNFLENNAYQFTYRYWYKDYQYSVLAAYSPLVPFSFDAETNNFIQVELPVLELIDEDVQAVDICVRYGNYGKTFIVKTYDKSFYYDRVAIATHNAGSAQLGFAFFDDLQGVALDDVTANTSFDDVALKAETLELARNRAFLGNVLKGYDTPKETSLSVTLTSIDTGAGDNYEGLWGFVTLHANYSDGGCQDEFMYPFIYSLTSPFKFYYFSSVRSGTIWNGGLGSVPATINITLATYHGDTEAGLIDYLKHTQYPTNFGSCVPVYPLIWQLAYDIDYDGFDSVPVTMIAFTEVQATQFFKSASTYKLTIAFYDRYRRKCGVVKIDASVTIPIRTYSQTAFTAGLQWTLDNTGRIAEIPIWAYYYQIHITKNQSTRFFGQAKASDITYVLRNDDLTFTYGNDTLSETTYAIGVKVDALTAFGIGYTFTEGDFMRLYFDAGNENDNLRVIGQDGNWVLLAPVDVGTIDDTVDVLFEFYTPYRAQITEPYYETGNVYAVSAPGTANRAYSILTDVISGDTYALSRSLSGTDYIVEAMSPNDRRWMDWETDTGWVNYIDMIGQKRKTTNIDWSDTYIQGTKVNGINKFGALNTKDIGSSSGAIQKLQLTSKQQEQGSIMLIIAEQEALSAYLGEVQLQAAAASSDIITTEDVIGSINAMKNRHGTINPESVEEYNGTVWWLDVMGGVVAQYDLNGVIPVSKYKSHRFWDRYGKRYVEQGKAIIEGLCGFAYASGVADPSTSEYLLTIPQVEENVVTSGLPVGFAAALPSYSLLPNYASSVQNRFDLYDGQSKTMIYGWDRNRWLGAYNWLADCSEYVGNKLFSFKNGSLWLNNERTDSFNVIFGVEYPQRICFTSHVPPSAIEEILNIALESNQIPSFTVIYVEYPNEQISDLIAGDYSTKEGIQYAKWFKDRLSPNATGTADEKLYKGDTIRGVTPLFMIEFLTYDEKLILNFANIGFKVSRGHSNILPKKKDNFQNNKP